MFYLKKKKSFIQCIKIPNLQPTLSLLLCVFVFLLIHGPLWKPLMGRPAQGGRVTRDVARADR